jgi:hypothetical protein
MDKLKNKGYHIITITEPHDGVKYTFKLWWESGIWDWYLLFRKMLVCIGFDFQTVEEVLPEEGPCE